MRTPRFSDSQIFIILKQNDNGVAVEGIGSIDHRIFIAAIRKA